MNAPCGSVERTWLLEKVGRLDAHTVANGPVVEVEAVDADEGTLQDIVDDPEPGTEGRADATPAAGR